LSIFALSGCGQESSPQDNNEEQTPDQNSVEQGASSEQGGDQEEGREATSTSPNEEEETSGEDTASIEDWRTYSKELKNVKIQYPENWYYRRSLSQEVDNDYYLYVEFAPTSKVLRGQATTSIELIGANKDKEIEEREFSQTVKETEDRKFILRTNSQSDFQETIERMATTFQQLK